MLFNVIDFENENFSLINDEQLKDLFDRLKLLIDSGDEELKNKILDLIKSVDGSGSAIDADFLDGLNSSQFLRKDISDFPTQDEQFDLGSPTNKWNNIYAKTFNGNVLQAENADLAEKYTCKNELEIGDVVCISNDEYFEIEKCNEIASHKVIGVYSYKPAFLMNKEKKGFAIALKGRVPVKVIGKINKGDPLVSYKDGYAVSIFNKELLKDIEFNASFSVFAKALQSTSKEKDIIEVIIL